MTSNPAWTIDRVDTVKQFYGKVSNMDLVAMLNALPGNPVSVLGLTGKAANLGIRKQEPARANSRRKTRDDFCFEGHPLLDAYQTTRGELMCRVCSEGRKVTAMIAPLPPVTNTWPDGMLFEDDPIAARPERMWRGGRPDRGGYIGSSAGWAVGR